MNNAQNVQKVSQQAPTKNYQNFEMEYIPE
jgi:hypothetical protein